MNILITGCAGFIGSHLTQKLLSESFNVIGIDNFDPFYKKEIKIKNLEIFKSNPNFSFFELDILEISELSLNEKKIDIIIHLAAKAGVRPSIADPLAYLKTNSEGTIKILEFARINNINKIIFASSSSVYGNNKVPFNEDDDVSNPISPYAFTKLNGEHILKTYKHLYNINYIAFRFFTVYGPRQRPDLAINKFVNQIINNETIEMFGNGETYRDYTYIDDIVLGISKGISYLNNNNNVGEIINLGNNNPIKLRDLISKLYKILNKKENIKEVSMQAGDVNRTYANIDKAFKLLGYIPTTKIEEGLKKYIDSI